MEFASWKSHLDDAHRKFLKTPFGVELLTQLENLPENDTSELSALKLLVIAAEVKYAYLMALPGMMVVTGDNGVVSAGAEGNTAITRWGFLEVQKSVNASADEALEDALAKIDEMLSASPTPEEVLGSYINSSAYKDRMKLLVRDAREATQYLPTVGNSRILYNALIPYITRAENDYFKLHIGNSDVIDALKGKFSRDLTEQEVVLLDIARTGVMHFAFWNAIPFLNFSNDFRLVTYMYGNEQREQIPDNKLQQAREICNTTAAKYGTRLKDYLNENATNELFGEFFRSKFYRGKTVDKVQKILDKIDTSKNYVKF